MSALSSKSGEWQTPPWLVALCRQALGGEISLDAATVASNPVGALDIITQKHDALAEKPWLEYTRQPGGQLWEKPTLFLNPPGEKTGKLIRRFWQRWNEESPRFHASVWVDFNLDHLRFIERLPGDCLIIPRKRMAFVRLETGLEVSGAQIGGFILFRGDFHRWRLVNEADPNGEAVDIFPEPDFMTMMGERQNYSEI